MTDTTKERAQWMDAAAAEIYWAERECKSAVSWCNIQDIAKIIAKHAARAEQSTETRAMTMSEIPDELRRNIVQQTARECAVIAAEADTNFDAEREIFTRFDIEAEAPRPVGTPEKCPTCQSVNRKRHWPPNGPSGILRCEDSWHDAVGTPEGKKP